MRKPSTSEAVVSAEGPHVVEDMHTSGTAQTRHKLHTRLRHLTTGRLIDRLFAENERVIVAPLETRRVTCSYDLTQVVHCGDRVLPGKAVVVFNHDHVLRLVHPQQFGQRTIL